MLAITGTGFSLGLLVTAFGLGFRHGIDWDHIAALTDITSSERSLRRGLRLSTFYAVGHGVVVLALGLLAVLTASELPPFVDRAMEHVVGLTLVAFGVYVIVSLMRTGRDFRMQSRWMLALRAVRRAARRSRHVVIEHEHEHAVSEVHGHAHVPVMTGHGAPSHRHSHRHRHVVEMPDDPFARSTGRAVVAVGMLHGIGGETPTQIVLFATAAGAGGRGAGVAVLLAFVAGLLVSNTTVALAGALGFTRAARSWRIYAALTVVTATASIAIGALYLAGQGAVLTGLFGG